MLFVNLVFTLLSNAVTITREKSILYARIIMVSLISIFIGIFNSSYIKPLSIKIGIYNGLFNIDLISQYFSSFIIILTSFILTLNSFSPRHKQSYTLTLNEEKPFQNSNEVINYLNNIKKEDDSQIKSKETMEDNIKEDDDYQVKYEETMEDNNIKKEDYHQVKYEETIEDNIKREDYYQIKYEGTMEDNIKEGYNYGNQFNIIEYGLIILFVLFGAILLMSTGDLVSLFLSIELQSYGLYIISTIFRDSESSTNSGLTYFLLGGLSSCFILLGSAIIYVNSGNTNLDNIFIINSIDELTLLSPEIKESFYLNQGSYAIYEYLNIYKTNFIDFSLVIVTAGLLFKVSAAPFHFWSPDVYDGVPTVVTTFVAIIAKISIFILMLELISYTDININNNINENIQLTECNINDNKYEWKNIIALSSVMSLVIGSVLGLTQYRIKRLFAYSTISHVGFILLALCINSIESIQGYIFYILQYSVSNLNAFLILITIGYTLHEYIFKSSPVNSKTLVAIVTTINEKYKKTTNNEKYKETKLSKVKTDDNKFIDIENSPIQLLSQIKGYFYINSYLSMSFAITLFSFVGIPPLIGFFAKQMVLSAALDQGYIFITLVAIITSVIGAAYYLNLIKLMFFTTSDYINKNTSNKLWDINNNSITSINNKLSIIISIFTILILLFIFMPDEWFRIVNILSFTINI